MGKDKKPKDTEPNIKSAADLFEAIVNVAFLTVLLFTMVALLWH